MSDSESDSELIIDNKHKRKRIGEELEEKSLEKIVFGRESDVLTNINKKSKTKPKVINESIDENNSELYSELDSNDSEDNEEESDSSEDSLYHKLVINQCIESNEISNSETSKKSVWIDSDDAIHVSQGLEGIKTLPKKVTKDNKYKEYLENKFIDLYKTPKWAQKKTNNRSKVKDQKTDSNDSEESDDELMRTAQNFKIKSTKLEKGILAIKKCTNLTNDHKMKV
jgi:hypothetical protein